MFSENAFVLGHSKVLRACQMGHPGVFSWKEEQSRTCLAALLFSVAMSLWSKTQEQEQGFQLS